MSTERSGLVERLIRDAIDTGADFYASWGAFWMAEETDRAVADLAARLEKGVAAEIRALRAELERKDAALRELMQAMRDYSLDVDEPPPYRHRAMMERARAARTRKEEDRGE